jgi:AraC-like DNA-binding protein
MTQTNAYGQGFGEIFGLPTAPVMMTRVLRKAPVVVTEVSSGNPRTGPSDSIDREDAYLCGLQLRDYPDHQMWVDGKSLPTCDLHTGEMLLYDLRSNPVVLIDKPFHSIHFYLPRLVFDVIADDSGASRVGELHYPSGVGITDRTVNLLGQSILGAFENPERASRLFVDHVTLALATHIAQAYGSMRPRTRPVTGGLAPWQARRAKEILSANLDGSLSLADVASECGLSVSHFARAFRVTVGVAPHRWLLGRRLERARTLLAHEQMSLLDVALASGFADQSHFTRIFSREMGTSPGAWRRSLKD